MFQVILQSASTSLSSLWANKLRSFVTMLGIVIGVGSVVLIMSIGAGAQSLLLYQVRSLGGDLISIVSGHADDGDIFTAASNFSVTTLKYEDGLALRNNRSAPHIEHVAIYTKGFGDVIWRGETYSTSLNGTTASYLEVERGEIEEGRFITPDEERDLSRVIVLGHAVKEALFHDSNPIGQRVSVSNNSFEVIGYLKERGTIGIEDHDDQVLIPLRTMQRVMGINHVGMVRVRVGSEEFVDSTIESIRRIMREQHNIRDQSGESDDFTIASATQILGIVTTLTDGLRFFLTAMAALSLVVGGIGIMNIMLISVTERTREIGLRKAVGARDSHILGQFLLESIFITGIGGIIGIIFGIIFAFLVAISVQFFGYNWSFIISPLSILIGLGVSTGVGLFFGFYPALKASQLNPIEALRYE